MLGILHLFLQIHSPPSTLLLVEADLCELCQWSPVTYGWFWPWGAAAGDQGEGGVRSFWNLTEIPPMHKQHNAGSNRTCAEKNSGMILTSGCLI